MTKSEEIEKSPFQRFVRDPYLLVYLNAFVGVTFVFEVILEKESKIFHGICAVVWFFTAFMHRAAARLR